MDAFHNNDVILADLQRRSFFTQAGLEIIARQNDFLTGHQAPHVFLK